MIIEEGRAMPMVESIRAVGVFRIINISISQKKAPQMRGLVLVVLCINRVVA